MVDRPTAGTYRAMPVGSDSTFGPGHEVSSPLSGGACAGSFRLLLEDRPMSHNREQVAARAQLQIQALEMRPELAKGVPYPVSSLKALSARALGLRSGCPRVRAAVHAEASRIQALALEMRGMLNANLAYAASVVGHGAPHLKDLGGVPRASGRVRNLAAIGLDQPQTDAAMPAVEAVARVEPSPGVAPSATSPPTSEAARGPKPV